MSTTQEEINDKDFLSTYIKLENDTDEDLTNDKSSEVNNKRDFLANLSTTSTNGTSTLISTYKGKIEVTSKGRRKIFDGVRWQILCRRPECRKQTNKKSLCITHYKEEYESNTQSSSSSSWSNNLQPFQLPSYQQRPTFDKTKLRNEIEDQNNTITTTNITDKDEQQLSLNSNRNRSINDIHNSRRLILKNSKWRPVYQSNNTSRHDLIQQKRRDVLKFRPNDNRHSHVFNNHRSIFSNNITKRLKRTADFPKSSSSVTEQFDINSNENNYKSIEPIVKNFSSLTSKLPGHEIVTSSKTNRNLFSSDKSIFNKQKSELKTDQSVQTDLTIPLCCIIHQEDHTFYSSCKSTSSILAYNTKPEPQSFATNFST